MNGAPLASGVDFHCHLDLYPDHAAAIAQAEAASVFTLTVTTTPKAWPRNRELTEGTRYVRAALGLHPQLVAERAGELRLWERISRRPAMLVKLVSMQGHASTSRSSPRRGYSEPFWSGAPMPAEKS